MNNLIRQIRKRDGRVVDFNPLNIKKAINKASQATKTPVDIERVYEYTIKTLEEKFNGKIASVEDIQNEVEKALIHFDYPDTAKAYIIYRQVRNNEREGKYLVDIISLIDDYIDQKDWRVKENANASYSVSGLTFHIAGSVIANYSLYKYPKHISHAHRNGDIHIHDLSFGLVTAYCAGWDLEKLFLEGINNIPGKINSRPANHLTSATWQMINFIGTLQNEWAGAQAFNCYSDDTEVLTDKGWKLFKNLDRTEQIATLNKTTNRIEYQSPTKYFSKYYNGLMLHFRNKGLDMLVTPNHRLLLRQRTKTSKYTRPLILKEADSLGFDNTGRCRHGIPRYSEFFGEDKKFINIGNKKIKTEDFMPLLGIYLSEGSINRAGAKKGHYRIEITQIKEKTRIEIEELLKRLPFKYSKDKHCFYVYGKEIYKFFESQGYSHDRYIPREYLNLNKKYLKILLEWLIKGDGHNNSNGHKFYFTVSEKLRNDVIELVIKSGLYCSSYIFAKTGDEHTLSDGRTFKNKKDLWAVSIYDSDRDICIYEPEEILYNGTIHCVEVPNHIILTKRNGYVTWCGNSVDTLLAPFIRKDELTYKQVKQAMQGLIFNLNVPSRWAGQSPFSNFTFDWTIPEDRMDDIPMIGGKAMDFAYGDLQEESLMINKAFMEVLTEGDAKGSTFTFPIPTINITKEFDWNGPLTDELFALTAKYGPYYFANFVKSDLNPKDIRSMCCRLSLRLDELRNKMGGLFGAGSQTGSIAVTTINLPRIGYLSKDDNEFFSRLDNMLDIAKEAMEIKRVVVMKNLDRGLMPYTKRYLGHLNGHFSTIGIIGMNECLINYMGKGISDKDSYNFGLGVMDHIRSKLIEIQKETGNLYNLEATPAEGTTRRLAAKDKKHYPDIIVANEQKWREQKVAPYYTNSIHLPVGFTNDIFESLDLEEEFLTKFTGGCVKHIYLGERLPSADSARNLVKKVCSNYKVPYISITPSFSVCPTHGYVNGAHDTCPKEI